MPDTIRTLAELNAQFVDNAVGSITPQDIRDLMVSMMVYGEIGSGAKAAVTLATGYQAMDFGVAGVVSRGLTIDTVNKRIADIPVTLKADIELQVLFRGANNTTFDFTVFKNPDTLPVQINRLDGSIRIFSAAMIGILCVSASVQLAAGDKLQAAVRGGAVSFELLRGTLRVKRIGIE